MAPKPALPKEARREMASFRLPAGTLEQLREIADARKAYQSRILEELIGEAHVKLARPEIILAEVACPADIHGHTGQLRVFAGYLWSIEPKKGAATGKRPELRLFSQLTYQLKNFHEYNGIEIETITAMLKEFVIVDADDRVRYYACPLKTLESFNDLIYPGFTDEWECVPARIDDQFEGQAFGDHPSFVRALMLLERNRGVPDRWLFAEFEYHDF